jgi:hypothetical protein
MSDVNSAEQVMDRMLKAEKVLRDYLGSPTCEPEKHTELATAVKRAWDELIDRLETMCPPFSE